MEKPLLARYICLETHDKYEQGVIYSVEKYGMVDFGLDCRTWKINGETIDISKFELVHINISQIRL